MQPTKVGMKLQLPRLRLEKLATLLSPFSALLRPALLFIHSYTTYLPEHILPPRIPSQQHQCPSRRLAQAS